MIVGFPVATPLIIPFPEPIVAMPVLLLLQVPPVVRSLRVVVCPVHTTGVPVIPAGNGLTVTIPVMIQLVGRV